jgi:hypothetical protein
MKTYTVMLKVAQTHHGYGRNWRKDVPVTIAENDPYWPRLKGDDRFVWAEVGDPGAHEKLTGKPDRTEEQKQMQARRRREHTLKDAKHVEMPDHFQITPNAPPPEDEPSAEEVERILKESQEDAVIYDEEDDYEDGEQDPPAEVPPPTPPLFSEEVLALANLHVDHQALNRGKLDEIAMKIGATGPSGEAPTAAATKAIVAKWIADRQAVIHSQLPKVVDPA